MEDIEPRSLKRFNASRAQTRRLGLFVLIKFFKKINFFKVTSAVVAAIFFWNQIVWAGDIAVSALDNLNDNQAQTFAPAYLQKQNTLHKDIIDQKQAIEEFGVNQAALTTSGAIEPPAEEKLDLKGPIGGSSGEAVVATASYIEPPASVSGGSPTIPDPGAIISVTTQAGDVVHYIGSAIDYVERLDGSILRNLHFGGDGNLLDAYILYQDGRTFTVVNGLIASMEYPDHSVVTYTYIGGPGNITETIVKGPGKTAHYDASGRLTMVAFDNGRVAEYNSGILVRVRDIDGHEYSYETAEAQNGGVTEYMVSLKAIVSSSITYQIGNNNITSIEFTGFTLSDFSLDSGGNIVNGTIVYADSSRVFIENGRIRKVTSGIDVSTRYVYSGESVQQAINSAASGDTIYLHAGTYHEHITLYNGVNIIGEDNASTVIHGDYVSRSHVIRALGNNRIEGITISGSGPYAGMPSSAVRIEGSNVSIRNNRIVNNRDYGLHIWSGDNILIEKNFFKDNSLGVQLPNSGTTIQYNTFVNNNISINVLNGPATVIRNNIITGSTFQSIYEFSWRAYASGQPASGYAIVEGNILYSNVERGGYYCKCLPPAAINQSLGNRITNPLFVNPAAGNYSVPENSPAYGKGAFLPQALGDLLDSAAGPDLKPAVNTVSDTGITAPIPMPGDMFSASGSLIATYDFMNIPYFDVINYNSDRKIKNIMKPDGSIVLYVNIAANQILREFFSTSCMDDRPDYSAINSAAIADWECYTEYYADGVSAHKKWIKDPDVGNFGYEVYCEYDTQGRLIRQRFDDGASYSFEYAGDTAILQSLEAFASNGDWQYSTEYYEDGITIHYKRSADADSGTAGNEVYSEYDAWGRVIQQVLDDGSSVDTEYLDSSTIVSRRIFYGKNRFWKYSIAYRGGLALDKKWSADPNPGASGDVVYCEYDAEGREVLQKMDDESRIVISYNGASVKIFQKVYYDRFGTRIKTIEYWDDGETRHYEWVADSNPSVSGDVTCREYDMDGIMIKKTFDTGSIFSYTSTAYYTNWQYPSSNIRVGSDASGEIATFKLINGSYLISSVVWEGIMMNWSYNSSGVLQSYTKTLVDSTFKIYDSTGRVIEQDIPDGSFIKGVNLPWINYGTDMNGGFSGNPAALYTQFEKWKGDCVRIFLFCDLRSGINFDASGNPLSFKAGAYNDMNALLAAAKAFNIKLIPVLFDYMIADGKSGVSIGEHADLITDASKKQKLLNLFAAFFDIYAGDNSIYAWDVMNEPEFAGAVAISDTQSFISDFTDLIHSKSSQAKVTVGSARRDWMLKYWTGIGLDVYQYHYYDNFESSLPLGYSADSLGLDKPVIVGELQPTQVLSKLGIVKANGYAAGLFWQDQSGYTINTADYTAIRNYFSGSKATYLYYASGRIKTETWNNGTMREFEDLAFYKDGMGRLVKETFSDNSYITYQYYADTFVIKTVIAFSIFGRKVTKKDYSSTGAVTAITTYYDDEDIRKITNSDGTYRIFDQLGGMVEQAVLAGGVITTMDGQNNVLARILIDAQAFASSDNDGAVAYKYEYITAAKPGEIDDYTKFILGCDGSDGSTLFIDRELGTGKPVTANGNAQIDIQRKFGTGGAYFDGAGDYLSVPDSNDWNFGTGDFTIDFWLNPTTWIHDDGVIAAGTTSTNGWAIASYLGTRMILYSSDGWVGAISDPVIIGSWHHYAVVRSGNSVQWYIDGVASGSAADFTGKSMNSQGSGINIGRYNIGRDNYYYDGSIDELRISKGIARWTSNFTPPTVAYTSGSSTIKKGYSSINYADPSNPVLTGLLVTYEYNSNNILVKKTLTDGTVYNYYADTGYMESKTLPSEDTYGNTYYHYTNEKINGAGTPQSPFYGMEEGTTIEYSPDGSPLRALRPDGRSSEYYYAPDGSLLYRYEYSFDGSLTIFDRWGNEVYVYEYDPADMGSGTGAGGSAMSVTTTIGDIIRYENGRISSIERKADGSIITDIELDESGNLKNAHVKRADGSLDIVYANSVVETISAGGGSAHYRDGRKTFEYSDIVGYTRYSYVEDANHDITLVTTVNKNAACMYDANGLPVRFEKQDGSVTEYDGGYLKRIIGSNGRQYLYAISTGEVPTSTLITAAAEGFVPAKILYDASNNITSVILTDGTTLSSASGILQGITGLDSRINVDNNGTFSFDDGSYKAYYNENGDLSRITTSDNTDVYFNNGQISEVSTEDGTRLLYAGGRITDLYDRKEGASYVSDSQGRITKVTYDNGSVFAYHYSPPLLDGSLKVTITKEDDPTNVTVRVYDKDGLLVEQSLPSGIISEYTYEASGAGRILTISQTKNGIVIGSYSYQYSADKTLVTDIQGNIREYVADGSIKFMYAPGGYVYEYHMTENNTLVSELTRWDKANGITVYYKNGDVDRVETIGSDGKKTVTKEAVFDSDGKLKSFTVVLPTGESRRCTVYDNGWSEINTSDAKLIYKDDPVTGNGHLVAVNSNHRLFMFDASMKIPSYINVDITNDPSALDHIALVDGEMTDYMRQKLLKDYGVIKENPVPVTLVPGNRTWQAQTYSNMLGVSSVSTGSDMVVMQAAINNTAGHSQGEAFLDLTIDNIGHTITNPYDFNNMTMSFYVKLQDGTLPTGGSLTVQAFAKDANWSTEYSTQITITQAGVWCKIDLCISNVTPIFGLKDYSFNPSQIRLVGLRVISTAANFTYNGQIYLKDANHQTLPAGETVIDFPFFVNKNSIKPYVGAIPADQVTGNPNYISWADIPTLFLANSNTTNNGQINLDNGTWRAQSYTYSQGIETVARDSANNQWVLGLNLVAGDQIKNDGEMYVDLRYDIPGHIWSGPLDLTDKTLTFKVKAPAGFLAASNSTNSPMWAQIFVKDESYNYQYGRYVLITQEGQWITVTLIPQVGEIEEGNSKTSPDFDPTKIVNMGLKISCNKGSVSSYIGNFYVQNATPIDVLNQATGVYLLDINALKNYAASRNLNLTFEENLGPQIRLAKQSLPTYFKDSSFNMATEYYPDGSIKSVLKGNSRVEYYNTSGKLIKITDKNDETLVEYKYDPDGNLVEIDYSGTRDTIRKAMDEARMQAQQQADDTIIEIAEAKGIAIQYISDTIQPALDEAYRTRFNLQAMWNEWNRKRTGWFGQTSREEKKAVMHSLEAAMRQLDQTISGLLAQAAALYAQVNDNINTAKQDIATQLNASLNAIDVQEAVTIQNSMEQEVVEVASFYYRQALGRDASSTEITYWLTKARQAGCLNPINRIAFDASLVKTELATKQVYVDEAAGNNSFILAVNNEVAAYLRTFANMSAADKNTALAALGLSAGDVSYSASDFESIIKWLSLNNKHFGKSAFLALKEILANNGKSCDLPDLAAKTILIDIFTGSITGITGGELQISIFALSKYAAQKEGITLYNTKLDNGTIDALRSATSGGKKAIVRINGSHFITVTSIDANGNVSYFESSVGSSGESVTMNCNDFLSAWDGFAISQRAPPIDAISRILTQQEAMLVRGSDIFIIFAAISIISALVSTVLSFIDNEICQMLSNVFAIVSLVTGVLAIVTNLGNIITHFMDGLVKVGEVLSGKIDLYGALLKQGVMGFAKAAVTLASNAAIQIARSISYNKALTTFGLNSDLAGITSAFLSGGFTGVDPTFSLVGGLTSFTMEAVRYAGRELELDPTITNIIGLSAATIVSAGLGGVSYKDNSDIIHNLKGLDAISYTIGTTVLPNVASELAYYGITKIGEMIGIDSIVSQLAGIGIRSSLQLGLQGADPSQIWTSVTQGLLQGVTQIGLNYATQELGLNPLLANLGFSAISTAINAGLQVTLGATDPNTGKPIDYLEAIYDIYTKNALTFLGYGDPNNAWLQAAYISQILDFSEIATERGFVEALNVYGASFFNAVAVNSIVTSGMSIGQYFASKLDAGQYTLKVDPKTGTEYKEIGIGQNGEYGAGLFTGNQETGYTLRGKTEEYGDTSFWGFGDVGVDAYGKMGFTDAELATAYNGIWRQNQTIDDGLQVYADVVDLREAGRRLLAITPDELLGYNAYGLNGEYSDVSLLYDDIYDVSLHELSRDIFSLESSIRLNVTESELSTISPEKFNLLAYSYDVLYNTINKPAYAAQNLNVSDAPETGKYWIQMAVERPAGLAVGDNLHVLGNSRTTGHTFIRLADDVGGVKGYGYYPGDSQHISLFNAQGGSIVDDSTHTFSESTQWVEITREQYDQLKIYMAGYRANVGDYSLPWNNCTHFAMNAMRQVGIDIPYGTGLYANPQHLGNLLHDFDFGQQSE